MVAFAAAVPLIVVALCAAVPALDAFGDDKQSRTEHISEKALDKAFKEGGSAYPSPAQILEARKLNEQCTIADEIYMVGGGIGAGAVVGGALGFLADCVFWACAPILSSVGVGVGAGGGAVIGGGPVMLWRKAIAPGQLLIQAIVPGQ